MGWSAWKCRMSSTLNFHSTHKRCTDSTTVPGSCKWCTATSIGQAKFLWDEFLQEQMGNVLVKIIACCAQLWATTFRFLLTWMTFALIVLFPGTGSLAFVFPNAYTSIWVDQRARSDRRFVVRLALNVNTWWHETRMHGGTPRLGCTTFY
jgi:hypothetical protein